MGDQRVQTKREIEEILEKAGVRPRRRFGQHFLIDGNLIRRLVASAQLQPQDVVLEVGAGTGGLTDLLAWAAARVICVEIDRTLQGILAERFRDVASVTLVAGDVLENKHRLSQAVAELLNAARPEAGGSLKLVANLPYQVATPVLMDLLLDYPRVRRFCFTVQAEVGERILSPPGRKAYGPLGIFSQLLCECHVVARIKPDAFWPKPQVASLMIRMDVKEPAPFGTREEIGRFAELVRKTFEHRRKTLRSALRYVLDDEQRERICRVVDGNRRPESFSVAEWLQIFEEQVNSGAV